VCFLSELLGLPKEVAFRAGILLAPRHDLGDDRLVILADGLQPSQDYRFLIGAQSLGGQVSHFTRHDAA
jgi:hypothetical protein